MLVTGHLQSGWKSDVLRGRGWHLRGLGAGASINATTRGTGTSTSTATQTTLPARGAIYQTVVPNRPGAGLTTQVPAGRTGVINFSSTTTYNAPAVPTCPALTYWNTATRTCVTPSGATQQPGAGATQQPPAGSTTATITSYLPWILGGAAVLVVVLMMAKR